MIADIDKRIARKLAGIRMAFRGVITLVKTAGNVNLVQFDGLKNEKGQDNEYFQHWGLATNPPVGSMAIVLPIGGKTAHGVVIATEHGIYRLRNLKPGESALYDDQGQIIHITRDGIVITGAGKPVTITDTPKVRMETTLLEVTGEIKDKCDTNGKTMSSMRTTYNTHTHTDPQGGSVAAPSQGM